MLNNEYQNTILLNPLVMIILILLKQCSLIVLGSWTTVSLPPIQSRLTDRACLFAECSCVYIPIQTYTCT